MKIDKSTKQLVRLEVTTMLKSLERKLGLHGLNPGQRYAWEFDSIERKILSQIEDAIDLDEPIH